MQLTCPKCETGYEIDSAVIPPEGRSIRCWRCRHTWVQEPEPERPVTPEPQSAQSADTAAAEPEFARILREEAEREHQARERDRQFRASSPSEPEMPDAHEQEDLDSEAISIPHSDGNRAEDLNKPELIWPFLRDKRQGNVGIDSQPDTGRDESAVADTLDKAEDNQSDQQTESATQSPASKPEQQNKAVQDQGEQEQKSDTGNPDEKDTANKRVSEPLEAPDPSEDNAVESEPLPPAGDITAAKDNEAENSPANEIEVPATSVERGPAKLDANDIIIASPPEPEKGDAAEVKNQTATPGKVVVIKGGAKDSSQTASNPTNSASLAQVPVVEPMIATEPMSEEQMSQSQTAEGTAAFDNDFLDDWEPGKQEQPAGGDASNTAAASVVDSSPKSDSEDGQTPPPSADTVESIPGARQNSSFRFGLWFVILAAIIATLVFIFAPQLSEQFPEMSETLTAYAQNVERYRATLSAWFASFPQ